MPQTVKKEKKPDLIEISAKAKFLKISSKKVRLVLDVVRGMRAEEAQNQLRFIPKKASKYILKLLNSAIANAEHNFNLKKENLYIKKIIANEGPTLKRWMPKAYGRATVIRKRSSHIEIVLAGKVESGLAAKKKTMAKPVSVKSELKKGEIPSVEINEEKKVLEKEGYKPEIIDANREGKHRHREQIDRIKKNEGKTFLKRIFRRKSG